MRKSILIIFVVLIIFGGFVYYKKSATPQINPEVTTYRNSNLGISFKYPKKLQVTGNNERITLHHEVQFTHHDYCDFVGESTTTIDTLTDFHVTLHIVNKNLVDTVRSESPYIPEENFLNGKIVPSPGFIDPVDFGNLKGFSIFEGAEGCGHTVYYLTVSDKKTLVVINDFITIFSGSIDTENMQKALQVPGVINRESAESLFDDFIKNLVVR